MIEWRLAPADVARIRFGLSPLLELVLSLIVLRVPGRHSLHLPWVRATRPLVSGLELSELFALVPVTGVVADFLTPPPTSPLPDLGDELESVRRAPPEQVVLDTSEVPDVPDPTRRRILDDPEGAADRIADSLRAYWDVALDAHWTRIRALLEADVLWRSQRLAVAGAGAAFDELHESVTWHGDRLSVTDPAYYSGDVSGDGLLLTPSTMCWPTVRKMLEPYRPALVYPARGIATLWETGRPPAPHALTTLLGRTRAQIIVMLAEPTSTTTLARRLSITPGAVSQHLSLLHDCGLVTRSRVGRSVLYRRSGSGDALVEP